MQKDIRIRRTTTVGSEIAKNEERRHLAASIQRPIDGLSYLIIFSSRSMGFDANRCSASDRGRQPKKKMSGRSVYVTPQNMPSEQASELACVRALRPPSFVCSSPRLPPVAARPPPPLRCRRRRVIKRRSEFRMRFPDDPRSEKNARTDGRTTITNAAILPPSLARCHFIAVARRSPPRCFPSICQGRRQNRGPKCPTTLVHPRSVPFRASSLNNSCVPQRIRG